MNKTPVNSILAKQENEPIETTFEQSINSGLPALSYAKKSDDLEFRFARELKKVVKDIDDNNLIVCQIRTGDGSILYCNGSIAADPNNPKITYVTLRHDQLKMMPTLSK